MRLEAGREMSCDGRNAARRPDSLREDEQSESMCRSRDMLWSVFCSAVIRFVNLAGRYIAYTLRLSAIERSRLSER